MNWAEFIRSHMAVLAGIDFFTVEVLTWRGLATYYVLFFLHLETRRVILAGITRHRLGPRLRPEVLSGAVQFRIRTNTGLL
jgi:hypothetical protein